MEHPIIHTIGHSNTPIDGFLQLLHAVGITNLVDVRSVPFSRFSPQYNKERLKATLSPLGIAYSYLGDLLGGRIDDPECYRDGVVNVRRTNHAIQLDTRAISGKEWFQRGIRQVLDIAGQDPTALMCSEEDPSACHRNLLIARILVGMGVPVLHIRRNGILQEAAFQEDLW